MQSPPDVSVFARDQKAPAGKREAYVWLDRNGVAFKSRRLFLYRLLIAERKDCGLNKRSSPVSQDESP
jgi:hypothetical protein